MGQTFANFCDVNGLSIDNCKTVLIALFFSWKPTENFWRGARS